MDDKNYTLENSFFKIPLDPASGTIQSLTDKKSGKEIVAADSEWKFGQYVTERFSKTETDQYARDYIKSSDHWHWAYAELGRINLSNDPYKKITGSEPDIRFTRDEISASAEIHFEPKEKHGHKYTVIITLYRNSPYVELIWSINFTEWTEGSWNARFYLWAFDSYINEHSIITPSEEFRNPLVATYVSGQPGPLPLTGEGIKLW